MQEFQKVKNAKNELLNSLEKNHIYFLELLEFDYKGLVSRLSLPNGSINELSDEAKDTINYIN